MRSAVADRAFESWRMVICRLFNPLASCTVRAPLTIVESVLRRSRYPKHFPQHVAQAISIIPGQEPLYLTPATCLHIYGEHADMELKDSVSVMIEGPCMRYEGGNWEQPFWLPGFTMTEFVAIGTEEHIANIAISARRTIDCLFERAGIRPLSAFPQRMRFF